jgi:AraC-like DNA-binding protein
MKATSSSHKLWRPDGFPDIELQRGVRVFDHDLGPHFHDTYQFVLIEDGSRWFRYRRTNEIVGAGVLTTVLPGDLHAGSCSREAGSGFLTLHLPAHYVRGIDPALHAKVEAVPFSVGDTGASEAFRMLHLHLAGEPDRAEFDELLVQFLGRLVRFSAQPVRPVHGKSGLQRAREFIHGHFRESRPLDEMAEISCLSKFHFVREFTRVFGASPLAYRNAMRMVEARRLLSAGNPIKAIALDLGFADQSHFGRAFRKSSGFTPAAYQRAVRSGPRSFDTGSARRSPRRALKDVDGLSSRL